MYFIVFLSEAPSLSARAAALSKSCFNRLLTVFDFMPRPSRALPALLTGAVTWSTSLKIVSIAYRFPTLHLLLYLAQAVNHRSIKKPHLLKRNFFRLNADIVIRINLAHLITAPVKPQFPLPFSVKRDKRN
jgi:hypothetical protein